MSLAYTLGELWDRWTIEHRKLQYGADNLYLVQTLEAAINEFAPSVANCFAIAELAMANDSISVLEWQIRADHKLSDEEVGIRAREIRKINARRVAAKNFIDGRESTFTPALSIDLSKVNLAVPDSAK